ncbi:MAG: hypothetical protein ABGY09_07900 [Euryarchaeota archaeon]
MRVSLSPRARRIWRRLTGGRIGLEEALRSATPAGVEEIRALGCRRSVGVVRRVDQLWVVVKGGEKEARELEDRLVDLLSEVTGERRMGWGGRVFLRVTAVGDFERPEAVRSVLERRCLACAAISGALALLEVAWCPLNPSLYAGIAIVSTLSGYLLPWRSGSFELMRECLDRRGRLPALVSVAMASLTFAGLGLAFALLEAGAGLPGLILAACGVGVVSVRFLDRVNRELVRAGGG